MNVRATRRGIPTAVKWGGLVALAWATLTVVAGGGSAHADESDGPLDGLTSIVSETVSAVTTPVVSDVVAPVVTQVVAPAVTAVIAPVQQEAPVVVDTVATAVTQVPIVGAVAAPIVQAVAQTAEGVVAPVTDALTHSPVAQIADPILDAVTGLPILGDLVDDLGAADLVRGLIGVVDGATGVIGEAGGETLPPILEPLDPTASVPPAPGTPGTSSAAQLASATASALYLQATTPALASASPVVPATIPRGTVSERGASDAPSGPSSGAPPGGPGTPSSFAGSGGGSHSAHARVSDVGASPLRAWERAAGASDDALPTSPVFATDVSPD
ncbi:hypothetical protein ABS642_14895 [Microbacterium sp. A8/3-1]|uniref:Uncharacterized protein n=1 Tax=Microbacterium sp. A8/3-1 TaxID=3160749 RepID=A0AAU7VUC8_9MICO